MNKPTPIVLIFLLGLSCLLAACASHQQTATVAVETEVIKQPPPQPARTDPWLLIDTKAETLTVMEGNRPMEVFNNIAVGSRGAGVKRTRGDEITPVGNFTIGWVNPTSRFNLFFGLDYPNKEYADTAYREGRIDRYTYARIVNALSQGQTPPQDTPLGGSIGIHGLGAGDPEIHSLFNWTTGCIALDNYQIERLAHWVRIGTQVEIRG
ncbi:MAG: L,D-transpeptidase [Gammaproteobacteria bacterium]|nr:L,D-transpeptidase [Gammaproteobacteria bacterium]MCP5459420.1 L,D-transpeptidase [Gammaproteobacteria bacterium]